LDRPLLETGVDAQPEVRAVAEVDEIAAIDPDDRPVTEAGEPQLRQPGLRRPVGVTPMDSHPAFVLCGGAGSHPSPRVVHAVGRSVTPPHDSQPRRPSGRAPRQPKPLPGVSPASGTDAKTASSQ